MKFVFIIISLSFLFSCSNYVFYDETINQRDASKLLKKNLKKEEFVKIYDKETLTIYSDEKVESIILEIKNQEREVSSLQKDDLFNIIGTPYLIKNELEIELWQYRNPFCILNVFWNNNETKIDSIQSYDYDLKVVNNQECLTNTIKLSTES